MKRKSRMPAEERRAQILEVASNCFADHGYANTTTARIADSAGITEPVLYRHFASKQDLFVEILQKTLRETMAHFRDIIGLEMSGAEKILTLVSDFPRYVETQRGLFRVIERAAASAGNETTRSALRQYYDQFVKLLANIIREGRADGSINSEIEALDLAWMLTMNGVGFCLMSGLQFEYFADPRFADGTYKIVAALLGYSPTE